MPPSPGLHLGQEQLGEGVEGHDIDLQHLQLGVQIGFVKGPKKPPAGVVHQNVDVLILYLLPQGLHLSPVSEIGGDHLHLHRQLIRQLPQSVGPPGSQDEIIPPLRQYLRDLPSDARAGACHQCLHRPIPFVPFSLVYHVLPRWHTLFFFTPNSSPREMPWAVSAAR